MLLGQSARRILRLEGRPEVPRRTWMEQIPEATPQSVLEGSKNIPNALSWTITVSGPATFQEATVPSMRRTNSPIKIFDYVFGKSPEDSSSSPDMPPNASAVATCPYYRWLHPLAKTKRLQYFNSLIPTIYFKTFHLLRDDDEFQEVLKAELKLRWDDKSKIEAMRRKLDVAQRYWGRLRQQNQSRVNAYDLLTLENGKKTLFTLLHNITELMQQKQQLLISYLDEERRPRKGFEERKEYTEETLTTALTLRDTVCEFLNDLQKIEEEIRGRDKLSEQELEKARVQLRRRRIKEASKKKRKRVEARVAAAGGGGGGESEVGGEADGLEGLPLLSQPEPQGGDEDVVGSSEEDSIVQQDHSAGSTADAHSHRDLHSLPAMLIMPLQEDDAANAHSTALEPLAEHHRLHHDTDGEHGHVATRLAPLEEEGDPPTPVHQNHEQLVDLVPVEP